MEDEECKFSLLGEGGVGGKNQVASQTSAQGWSTMMPIKPFGISSI